MHTPAPSAQRPKWPLARPLGEWAPLLALALVLAAIVALVAVPVWGTRASRALNLELTDVIAPARGQVTRINASLAVQGSLLRDYLASHDQRLTERYHQAYARERDATELLRPLVSTGPVQEAFDAFLTRQRDWHQRIDTLLRDTLALRERDPLRSRDYEALLASVVALDEAFEAAGNARRADIRRLDARQGQLAAVLGLAATSAALAVGWLARGLRQYATALERQSQALQHAIASRARLMRGVTHDLKNPLQVIDGHAQLLGDGVHGPVTPDQHTGLGHIRRASRDMLALIEDLLDLARAEAGQLKLRPQLVDLGQLTRDMVAEYHPAAKRAGVSIAAHAVPERLPTVTDPARVRQVIENLLSNAVKYTPREGQVTVAVTHQEGTSGTPATVTIAVANTGPGIPVEQQQAIFGDFTRLDEHADIPGAGLGLSIARRVAGLLGGELTLLSEPGAGATFALVLPRDRRRPADAEDGEDAGTAPQP